MRHSPPQRTPSPPAKRHRSDSVNAVAGPSTPSWTRAPVNYERGIHLAPMVRSGTMPTRLLALEAGAELVWSPETVDRAVIGCERIVDPITGVISYTKKNQRPVFTIHPMERSRLIFQIGSSNPELAAQAAQLVYQDVAGIDLNCGCPKHFSVHAGMGAGLLTNPDNLCAILRAIRAAVPPEVPVSCKIRMLESQEDTLALVQQIVDTGAIQCLTVHCRTRTMRDRNPALIHRLRDIVDAVGSRVVVVENGDCTGFESAERIRKQTGVTAAMIARGAEANPTCFSEGGLLDAETEVIPRYLRLARHLDHHWSNAKFCFAQFTSPNPVLGKAGRKHWKDALAASKSYEELIVQWKKEPDFLDGGAAILAEIEKKLAARARTSSASPVTAEQLPIEASMTSFTQKPMLDVVPPIPPIRTPEIQAVV